MLEENLSVTDNTEETYADTEGGDSLIDYGEEVGNKEPGEPTSMHGLLACTSVTTPAHDLASPRNI